jgi:hypothetical protein
VWPPNPRGSESRLGVNEVGSHGVNAMNNLDSALLCLETDSVAFGYRVLRIICDQSGTKILQAQPFGGRFRILAIGDKRAFDEALSPAQNLLKNSGREQGMRHSVIENINSQLLEALFHLPSISASEALLVVEAESLCSLLNSLQQLIAKQPLQVIEIKTNGSMPGAHAILTGSAAECRLAKSEPAMVAISAEVIEELPAPFRRFFNLTGEI